MSVLAFNMGQMVPMVGAVCLSVIFTCQKLLKTSTNWGSHTTGRPGTVKFTRSRHNTLPLAIMVQFIMNQRHWDGRG